MCLKPHPTVSPPAHPFSLCDQLVKDPRNPKRRGNRAFQDFPPFCWCPAAPRRVGRPYIGRHPEPCPGLFSASRTFFPRPWNSQPQHHQAQRQPDRQQGAGLPRGGRRNHDRPLICKTPLKELTRSRKFQQPGLANLWKSIGKSFLRKRMAWL